MDWVYWISLAGQIVGLTAAFAAVICVWGQLLLPEHLKWRFRSALSQLLENVRTKFRDATSPISRYVRRSASRIRDATLKYGRRLIGPIKKRLSWASGSENLQRQPTLSPQKRIVARTPRIPDTIFGPLRGTVVFGTGLLAAILSSIHSGMAWGTRGAILGLLIGFFGAVFVLHIVDDLVTWIRRLIANETLHVGFRSLIIVAEKYESEGFLEVQQTTTTTYNMSSVRRHTLTVAERTLLTHPHHLWRVPLFSLLACGGLFLLLKTRWIEIGLVVFFGIEFVLLLLSFRLSVLLAIEGKMESLARREQSLTRRTRIKVVGEKDWEGFQSKLRQI